MLHISIKGQSLEKLHTQTHQANFSTLTTNVAGNDQLHKLSAMFTVMLSNLWIRYRRQLLVSKSVDGLLVLAQIQLGADKNDWRRWAVMTHLRKPLLTTIMYIIESSKLLIELWQSLFHNLIYAEKSWFTEQLLILTNLTSIFQTHSVPGLVCTIWQNVSHSELYFYVTVSGRQCTTYRSYLIVSNYHKTHANKWSK